MRIYISGPITGTDDYMERFAKAEEELTAAGHQVYNPAHANSFMPEGWQQSRGAKMEHAVAAGMGYKLMFEEG